MIRLGKLALYHCDGCNLPLLKRRCTCGNEARQVKITPPGDVRPAFEFDMKMIKEAIEKQFGSCYMAKVVLLNNIPSIDRNDEVIMDGRVAGNFFYDIFSREYKFQPRPWYASMLDIKKGYVIADKGAIASILKSSNLMAPGVREADEEIKEGDEVIVIHDGEVIATGKARMDGDKMKGNRGMAVKIRWRGIEKFEKKKKVSWNDVIKANEDVIHSYVKNEERFIENVMQKYNLKPAISFSGGKDSLAMLSLVVEAGYEMPIIFANTGLEFEETVKHVYDVASFFGLELIEGNAGDKFWKSIDFFGPPARDYRWCCKVCKLGVIGKIIKERFPKGLLSFIGQRRYESERRAEHGKIWKNPWVHGQIAVSPIQNWTALHIWLYLFIKKLKWNELYEKGFYRIGCWLCPACNMADFELKKHNDFAKFNKKLEEYAKKHRLPKEWLSYGLWRWRRPPRWSGIKYEIREEREYEIEGNKGRIENFLRIVGKVNKIREGEYEIDGIKVKLGKEIEASKSERLIKDVIFRAINCVGCYICYSKCPANAIYMKDGKAYVNNKCKHCLECMDECVVTVFK